MRYALIIFSLFLAGCSGLQPAPTPDLSRPQHNKVPVLLYHHIQELPADATESLRRWSLTPQQLTEHLQWIESQKFSVITMARYNDHLQHGTPLPENPLILTFDDGWKDHYTVVFPLLEKYHFPATFFVTTESVGHAAFVNWEDLQKMAASKFADIQSHSATHPHLTRLKNEEAYREINESKKQLENRLQKPMTVFAYPFGNHSEKVIEMVKKAGYESATVVSGSNIGYLYRADKRYTINRIAVEGDMTLEQISQRIQKVKQ